MDLRKLALVSYGVMDQNGPDCHFAVKKNGSTRGDCGDQIERPANCCYSMAMSPAPKPDRCVEQVLV